MHRGTELSAQATYQRRALEHSRLSVRYRTVVEEILGEETVTGVRATDLGTGETADIETGAVFVYVGLRPNTELLEEALQLAPDGRIQTDRRLRTELPGLIASGIVRAGSDGQAATSAADGVTAAISADRYLSRGAWPEPPGVHAAARSLEGESDE
jgi:thioredoxin reductase (NADPH)